MKKVFWITVFILGITQISVQAQNYRGRRSIIREINHVFKAYEDSLLILRNKYLPELDSLYQGTLPVIEEEDELNPHYFKLFIPLTYYRSPIRQAFDPEWKPDTLKSVGYPIDTLFPVNYAALNEANRTKKVVNKVLLDTYLKCPDKVVTTEQHIAQRRTFQERVNRKGPPKGNVVDLFKPDSSKNKIVETVETDFIVKKPNFWITGGGGSLQFAQNYISDNWHKGGESTNALNYKLELSANYNDKKKLEFDNKLEMKLGFITAPSDTLHSYKPNDDLLRLTSKLGIKAISSWYYTVSAEFNTQLFTSYKTNLDEKQSAFLSPGNLLISLGMDYKINKEKLNLSVIVSPASYKFKFVTNNEVNPTAHGIKEGKKTLKEIGSQLQPTMKWTIIPSIVWESRFSYFTTYKNVVAEWENTFNFVLNRYLSTKLFVHARFDDTVAPADKGKSYFQLKELLSFGFNYSW